MCYKDETQNKAAERLNKLILDCKMPKFISDFFKSKPKLKSKEAHIRYFRNFKSFFEYLIAEEIISRTNLSEINREDVVAIKKSNIDQYLIYCRDTLGNSNGTVSFKLNSLRSLFSYFLDDEIVTKNVTSSVSVDKQERKELKFTTIDDVKELIAKMENEIVCEFLRLRNVAIASPANKYNPISSILVLFRIHLFSDPCLISSPTCFQCCMLNQYSRLIYFNNLRKVPHC